MLDEANKIKFLRDGLVHYPDARETVDYFERSVKEAIVAAFEAKTNWKNFRPHRGDSTGSLQVGNGTGDRFIHAFLGARYRTGTETKRRSGLTWVSIGILLVVQTRPLWLLVFIGWTRVGRSHFSISPVVTRRSSSAPFTRGTNGNWC